MPEAGAQPGKGHLRLKTFKECSRRYTFECDPLLLVPIDEKWGHAAGERPPGEMIS